MTSSTAGSLTVLVVCTGNVCRSPLAERLLTARARSAGVPLAVSSAGTRALQGRDMTEQTGVLALRYGADPLGHTARQLFEHHVASADLILTAERDHRRSVVQMFPRASRYTYTLNQFARLISQRLASDEELSFSPEDRAVDRLRAFIAEIAAYRGLALPPGHPDDDDVVDPYRQSDQVYEASGRVVERSVAVIVDGFVTALRSPGVSAATGP